MTEKKGRTYECLECGGEENKCVLTIFGGIDGSDLTDCPITGDGPKPKWRTCNTESGEGE